MDPLLKPKIKGIYVLTSVVYNGNNCQFTRVQAVIKAKYSLEWQLLLYKNERGMTQQFAFYNRSVWHNNRMTYNLSLLPLKIILN